jgi:hypothetical protein
MYNLRIKDSICLTILLIFVAFDIFHFTSIRIGPDSGYYLGVARDWWSHGSIPLVDTHSRYTPLGYLFYMLPFIFVKSPPIQVFLFLNLFLFILSAFVFLNILKNEIQNNNYLLLIFISFLFTFNGVTHDIKLENIVLFFNILILYQISKVTVDSTDTATLTKRLALIGVLCVLAFLTKQFAGLSVFLTILLLYFKGFQKLKLFRVVIILCCVFFLGILGYVALTVQMGQSLEYTLTQIKGKLIYSCIDLGSGGGQDYGERNWTNLIIALKYYRLNFLFIFSFIVVLISIVKRNAVITIKYVLVVILFIALVQLPFYFQIFPHYIHFGVPFVFYLVTLFLKKYPHDILFMKINLSRLMLILTIFLCSYSFWQNGKSHQWKKTQFLANEIFDLEINKKIPRGSVAFMINNRRLYYTCNFITPVPRTLGYAFVGLNCFINSINAEKPIDFWLADIHKISDIEINGYQKIDSHEVVMSQNRFFAVHFKKL